MKRDVGAAICITSVAIFNTFALLERATLEMKGCIGRRYDGVCCKRTSAVDNFGNLPGAGNIFEHSRFFATSKDQKEENQVDNSHGLCF